MSGITSLVIPDSLIEDAKKYKINCSKVAREALEVEVNKKKAETPSEG